MSEPGFSGLKDLQDFSLLTMYSLKVLSRKPLILIIAIEEIKISCVH